jgi:hypothetical protein
LDRRITSAAVTEVTRISAPASARGVEYAAGLRITRE